MLVHRRVTPSSIKIRRYPFIHLGGERHYESKVFCPRTQRSAPARDRTRTVRSGVQRTIVQQRVLSFNILASRKRVYLFHYPLTTFYKGLGVEHLIFDGGVAGFLGCSIFFSFLTILHDIFFKPGAHARFFLWEGGGGGFVQPPIKNLMVYPLLEKDLQ